MSDPSGPALIHEFRIGEAYDDVVPAFVIDGRDYPDAGAAAADIREASAALHRLRLISDIETSTARADTPRSNRPTWPQWRERHIERGEPIGVRPQPAERSVPPGWTQMNEWLAGSHRWLRDQLTSAAGSVVGGRTSITSDRGPGRVGPGSVVLAEEKYRVDCVVLVVGAVGADGSAVLDTVLDWLRQAGWSVDEPATQPDVTTVRATNNAHLIDAVWRHDARSVRLFGKSPLVDATIFAGAAPTAG
jgi:hypothetical protein